MAEDPGDCRKRGSDQQSNESNQGASSDVQARTPSEKYRIHFANGASCQTGDEEKTEDDDGSDCLIHRGAVGNGGRRKHKRYDTLAAPQNEEADDEGSCENSSGVDPASSAWPAHCVAALCPSNSEPL